MNNVTINNPEKYDILNCSNETEELVRIASDGRVFWNGREVITDDEFRTAMLELGRVLRENQRWTELAMTAMQLDPIHAALDRLEIARDMLQLTVEQIDDPTMLYLVEDLSIIMQRLSTISERIA